MSYFKVKCTEFNHGGGAHSVSHTPQLDLRVSTSKGRDGREKGEGNGGEREGRK